MLSIKQAEAIVDRLTTILGKNINIFDENGIIIASGNKSRLGQFHYGAKMALETKKIVYVDDDFIRKHPPCKEGVNLAAYYHNQFLCIIGITGPIHEVKNYAQIVKEFVELMFQESERNILELNRDKTFRNFSSSYHTGIKVLKAGSLFDPGKMYYLFDQYKLEMLVDGMGIHLRDSFFQDYKKICDYLLTHQDTQHTIASFYRNNLNVTDTAGEMYIHRNTVLYRINKIKQDFNIDLFKNNICTEIYILVLLIRKYKK